MKLQPDQSDAPTITGYGPGWVAVLLESADAVLALEPSFIDLDVGVVGPHPEGAPEAFELRAFVPGNGGFVEDPVTGSLNASVAEWLLGSGRAQAPYVAAQGTALGRAGRVHVTRDDDGQRSGSKKRRSRVDASSSRTPATTSAR